MSLWIALLLIKPSFQLLHMPPLGKCYNICIIFSCQIQDINNFTLSAALQRCQLREIPEFYGSFPSRGVCFRSKAYQVAQKKFDIKLGMNIPKATAPRSIVRKENRKYVHKVLIFTFYKGGRYNGQFIRRKGRSVRKLIFQEMLLS